VLNSIKLVKCLENFGLGYAYSTPPRSDTVLGNDRISALKPKPLTIQYYNGIIATWICESTLWF